MNTAAPTTPDLLIRAAEAVAELRRLDGMTKRYTGWPYSAAAYGERATPLIPVAADLIEEQAREIERLSAGLRTACGVHDGAILKIPTIGPEEESE